MDDPITLQIYSTGMTVQISCRKPLGGLVFKNRSFSSAGPVSVQMDRLVQATLEPLGASSEDLEDGRMKVASLTGNSNRIGRIGRSQLVHV